MTLAMIGVIIYTEENRQQQKIRQSTQYLAVNVDKIEIDNSNVSKDHFNVRPDSQHMKPFPLQGYSDDKC